MIIDDLLKDKTSVAIAGHVRPDGDCVGSCLGLFNYIRKEFPQIEVYVYLDPIPKIFGFLKSAGNIRRVNTFEDRSFDLFISLDCGDLGRLGDAAHYFERAKHTLCVDHHLSNDSFAEVNYVFPEASSTCELVGQIIRKEAIDEDIAACLYTGMVTDTGVFQYSSTHRSTMEFAGFLMDTGIDYSYIVDHVFFEKSIESLKIMGIAIEKAKQFLDGRVIASFVTGEDMKRVGALPRHMEGIVSTLRSVSGTRVAFFLYQNLDGTYKGSARAFGDDVNLAELAAKYGGGGHAKAAGFTVEGDPQTFIEKLVADVEAIYQEKKA